MSAREIKNLKNALEEAGQQAQQTQKKMEEYDKRVGEFYEGMKVTYRNRSGIRQF